VGGRLCGIPLASVVETLRPLEVQALAGAPRFVLGLTVIRGVPTPVVDARRLRAGPDEAAPPPPRRLLRLRLGSRGAALAVDEVIGLRTVDAAGRDALPPLLGAVAGEAVEAIAQLDGELLLVLQASHLVVVAAA
jgi:purine-binding chemotaxis protein CheW